jgi:hypothetical protein
VSLGIDIGNDLGIIVPVTQYDEVRNTVYRCYRLGETAPLAKTPLIHAVRAGDWDEFTRAADQGVPLLSVTIDIDGEKTFTAQSGADVMAALARTVESAVPGEVVVQSEGEIVELQENVATTQFDDPVGGKMRVVQIPLDQLSVPDREAVEEGALLLWTVFQRDSAGTVDRISRVRLRHELPFNLDEMRRNAAATSAVPHGGE